MSRKTKIPRISSKLDLYTAVLQVNPPAVRDSSVGVENDARAAILRHVVATEEEVEAPPHILRGAATGLRAVLTMMLQRVRALVVVGEIARCVHGRQVEKLHALHAACITGRATLRRVRVRDRPARGVGDLAPAYTTPALLKC